MRRLPPERNVELLLARLVRAAGGEVRKVAWLGRQHAPDRLVLLPGRAVWVELKRTGERPRPGQLREMERLRRAGQEVVWLAGYDEVRQWASTLDR